MGTIILREIRESDFEDIFRMESDVRVREFIGGTKTREESREGLDIFLPHVQAHWAPRAICLDNDPRFIGYCGLQPLKKKDKTRFEIFYGLDPAFWGRGYATQAVKAKLAASDLERVYACVDGNNKRSIALVVRMGFEIEGPIHSEELQKDEILFSLKIGKDPQIQKAKA